MDYSQYSANLGASDPQYEDDRPTKRQRLRSGALDPQLQEQSGYTTLPKLSNTSTHAQIPQELVWDDSETKQMSTLKRPFSAMSESLDISPTTYPSNQSTSDLSTVYGNLQSNITRVASNNRQTSTFPSHIGQYQSDRAGTPSQAGFAPSVQQQYQLPPRFLAASNWSQPVSGYATQTGAPYYNQMASTQGASGSTHQHSTSYHASDHATSTSNRTFAQYPTGTSSQQGMQATVTDSVSNLEPVDPIADDHKSEEEDFDDDYEQRGTRKKQKIQPPSGKANCINPRCRNSASKSSGGKRCSRCAFKHKRATTEFKGIEFIGMTSQQARDLVYGFFPAISIEHLPQPEQLEWIKDVAEHASEAVRIQWCQRFIQAANVGYFDNSRASGRSDDQHKAYLKSYADLKAKFVDQPTQYHMESINARFRLLVDTVVAFYTQGERDFTKGGDNSGYHIDLTLPIKDRCLAIEKYLMLDKRVVMDVIEGRGIIAFVQSPEAYEKRKQDNVTSNSKKAAAKRAANGASTTQIKFEPSLRTVSQTTALSNTETGFDPQESETQNGASSDVIAGRLRSRGPVQTVAEQTTVVINDPVRTNKRKKSGTPAAPVAAKNKSATSTVQASGMPASSSQTVDSFLGPTPGNSAYQYAASGHGSQQHTMPGVTQQSGNAALTPAPPTSLGQGYQSGSSYLQSDFGPDHAQISNTIEADSPDNAGQAEHLLEAIQTSPDSMFSQTASMNAIFDNTSLQPAGYDGATLNNTVTLNEEEHAALQEVVGFVNDYHRDFPLQTDHDGPIDFGPDAPIS